jgi:hypothetical protein
VMITGSSVWALAELVSPTRRKPMANPATPPALHLRCIDSPPLGLFAGPSRRDCTV